MPSSKDASSCQTESIRRACTFVVVSVCTYFLMVFAAMAVVMAEGGGISCDLNCTPTQEFLSGLGFAGPAFVVGGSLAVGWLVSRGAPLSRIGTLTVGIIAAVVVLVLLAEAFA